MAVRLFAAPGSTVVTSLGGYPTFNYHVAGYGAHLHTVPYIGDREDIEALARAARDTDAAMVYLANPDNPMGSWWDADSVDRFIAAVPETTMIILDEAYGEFAPPGTLPPLDMTRRNLLRMRTFSKAYGLAGARIGYVIGEARNVSAFNRIRNHFGISNLAQAAGIAALADTAHLEQSLAAIRESLADTAAIARRHGLTPLPTATNFLAVDCGRDGAYAQAILDGLAQHGVFVRKPMVERLNRCIRISAGTEADRALLDEILGIVLEELR
jgi:histidinol-phosphate aminotransferase